MIDAMRQLALDYVRLECGAPVDDDPEIWYRELRETDPGRLFPWLVEQSGKVESYYTLSPHPQDLTAAVLEVHDLREGDSRRLPFNQPSGSQSPALGPVVKRTWKAADKTGGPSSKIQGTTLKAFAAIAKEEAEWSSYFGEVAECWARPRCHFGGKLLDEDHGENALAIAVGVIPDTKTVFLAYRDEQGRLPGDVPDYVQYLHAVLADTKYATQSIPQEQGRTCALCGAAEVAVYPNALKGAGINLANVDREGAFPGVDAAQAWKGYATCGACADLLYICKNYVAPDFLASIAGERALVLPYTQLDPTLRLRFLGRVRKLVAGIDREEVQTRERRLLQLVAEDRAVTSLTFLWADFGQSLENVRGIVSDVLPTRLNRLQAVNQQINEAKHPAFPQLPLENFKYDLRLSLLRPLLRRPGDNKAKAVNASKRLFDLRRDLAAAIYHGTRQELRDSRSSRRFWEEMLTTARWHLNDAAERSDAWGLLHEGWSDKNSSAYLTPAGWVHQLAKFLHYLRLTEVMPMPGEIYQPKCEALKPYFTQETALDSKEKAFAFILGALYGKVMQVQAARGVNVGANALTWLKRLTLTGDDLPELYIKVREKLLAYETEGSATVRQVVAELGELGTQLRDLTQLDETQACYHLLLGQSLATTIMPKKQTDSPDEEGVQE